MKKLILVRHGKSSWENNLPDDKRPLKKRAYTDAELIIKAFKLYANKPLKLISSKAVRALETAKLFKKGLAIEDKDFKIIDDLYTFDEDELLSVIRNQPDENNKLMIFGHNPAMTILVNLLGDKEVDNLPTTGLVVIDFEVDKWKDIAEGKTLVTLFPRTFK
ncbi:SixA phosphatase family protein [Mesonia maritima]|uniref:Phosphohistidine phosphatase n=1 Tax=Mesonia maritima TaxID=1793873 RepID=A0ABU1K549_9FLAO|nr:histidine phosphatase family protein [Mesonia maritima]MDR6300739.1 phosphohistidine phosphatase [Mesonia maritima]